MASKSTSTVVRPYAWVSIPIHMGVMAALVGLAHAILRLASPDTSLIVGAVAYLVVSRASRAILAREHALGMRAVRAKRYAEAIPHFEASYDFFTRQAWIDRWRYVVLLSSNAIPYREMALCNIAYCHAHLGEGARAVEYYERALREFPGSALAAASLERFRAAERAKKGTPPGKGRRPKKG